MTAQSKNLSFKLNKDFVEQYKNVKPDFGFNGLGELTYRRTYSRVKEDGVNEEWYETIERVVNGTYTIQKNHILKEGLPWSEAKAQKSAQEMYDRMFKMKFLPGGRGLWAMGTPIVHDRGLGTALQNCAFRSTKNIDVDFASPFCFMMDASMLGTGVGFDVKGAGKVIINAPRFEGERYVHQVEDSREGWVKSLKLLLNSYVGKEPWIEFDYSKIRPAGSPIKTFGGISQGAEPLIKLHEQIRDVFDELNGKPITTTAITDVMNMIGNCVIAGNVRRSAQIALGDESEEYLDLKNYEKNPHRAEWGWASNNTVYAKLGQDYSEIAKRISLNGEPGLFWLENVSQNGRMGELKHDPAIGTNPCSEQPLEDWEFCNLVETFINRQISEDVNDYLRTLKFAYLYAKTVTLVKTQWPESNRVMMKNRRIGTSMTGIVQFYSVRGIGDLKKWSKEGYSYIQNLDKIYSEWLAIPRSIRTTTIKPSGTVSLLAGATPGLHYPESKFYIRRIRISENSPLVEEAKNAGYHVEKDFFSANTEVISFPIEIKEDVRSAKDVTIWEQLSLAALMQEVWSDNAVSVTVTFDPETEGDQIERALDYYQYKLKAVSFLPRGGVYKQMPYEEIDEVKYRELVLNLKSLDFQENTDGAGTKFCDGDTCTI